MTSFEGMCHRVWRCIHSPFLVPVWSHHKHTWNAYDLDMAGCTVCGVQHVCSVATCEAIQCEDGNAICPITGFELPLLRLSENEYSECVTKPNEEKLNTIGFKSAADINEVCTRALRKMFVALTRLIVGRRHTRWCKKHLSNSFYQAQQSRFCTWSLENW